MTIPNASGMIGGGTAETAEKIIVAAFKILLPGMATRAGGIADIADLAFHDRMSKRNRRSLLHRLEESVDLLAERLSQFEEIEISDINRAEKKLAIEGVCHAMAAAELNSSLIIREQLDSSRVKRLVHPEAQRFWTESLISEKAEQYGEHYLALASRYVTALVRQLPSFTDDLLMEIFSTAEKIYDLIERGIATVVLPMYRQGVPSEISMFDANYLSDILQTYRDMELFGLSGLPPELCRQPIDVAYITLQSTIFRNASRLPRSMRNRSSIAAEDDEPMPELRRVDAAFAAVLEANMTNDASGGSIYNSDKGTRILLTGQAGSGKTTVAHWLAIRAAEHRFPESLRTWNDCIPFIVPLRQVFHGNRRCFPREDHLILASTHREREMPGDWIRMRLSGHALIILDGLDELSELHKGDFRSWLSKLELEYPRAHFVVTSRPDGLDYSWFGEQNFARLELHPMESVDVRLCIEAWFSAVITNDRLREPDYRKKQQRLLADLNQTAAVRELAETPLLCAMLCAFYAHNLSAIAPQTRGELYERVINSLVHTREVERSSDLRPPASLPLKAKLNLLQALARHLTEKSQTTINCWATPGEIQEMTARDVLAERLRGMTPVVVSVDELLRYLLDRSVVFRRITFDEAQFAHRSLQEYMAAADYADNGMVNELVERSAQAEWRPIISFAAGKMKMPMASNLVSRLLNMAETPKSDARALLLLAAQCYGSAGRLDPDVADRTKRLLTAVLPPRDFDESELVSYAGEEILPWLGNRPEWSAETATYCMRAAALIGGPGGITALRGYAELEDAGRIAASELLHDWQYFDANEFAHEILANLPFGNLLVVLDSGPRLHAASSLKNLCRVRVTARERLRSFESWSQLPHLEEIDWPNNASITSLDGIDSLRTLRKLNLSGARHLGDIGYIGELNSLQELYLTDCSEMTDISAIGNLTSLRVLVLDNCTAISDFSPIRSLRKLRTLSLNGCNVSHLQFCEGFSELRRLSARTRSGLSDVTALRTCAGLRRLELALAMRSGNDWWLTSRTNLEELSLSGAISAFDLENIGQVEGLRKLSIDGVGWITSLEDLSNLIELTHLSVTNCHDLRYAQSIASAVKLEYLDLSGSDISDTEFARQMSRLKQVYLARCRSLTSLSGLAALPMLEYLSIVGGAFMANTEELKRSSPSGQRLVIVQEAWDRLGGPLGAGGLTS